MTPTHQNANYFSTELVGRSALHHWDRPFLVARIEWNHRGQPETPGNRNHSIYRSLTGRLFATFSRGSRATGSELKLAPRSPNRRKPL